MWWERGGKGRGGEGRERGGEGRERGGEGEGRGGEGRGVHNGSCGCASPFVAVTCSGVTPLALWSDSWN